LPTWSALHARESPSTWLNWSVSTWLFVKAGN
jgi:hypothetical protein